MPDSSNSLFSIGKYLTLKLQNDQIIKGQVFAYDKDFNQLIIYESGQLHESATRKSFRAVNTLSVKEIIKVEKKDKSHQVPYQYTPLPKLDFDELKVASDRALKERKRTIGAHVPLKGQRLFDALQKTLPCSWKNSDIVVMGTTFIKFPYKVDNVSGGSPSQVEQIKKVLQGELQKINIGT